MFKKKPNIKPLAPLRSSDRRRTADSIINDLNLETKITADGATEEEKAAAIAERAALRNSLLPDNAQSARFTTTHGPELKQLSGTVYVGSHGEEQRILWVKMEEKMYPTVYTLWHNPRILPLLHTHDVVITKLQGGADLMIPGLAGGPPFPQGAKKGAIVAVASTQSPTVPLMVGVCDVDVSALGRVQGEKGHAVQNIHWSGDELWSWNAIAGNGGREAPSELKGWFEDEEEAETLQAQTAALDLQDEEEGADGGVSLTGSMNGGDELEGEDSTYGEMSTKEIDEAFRNAFLFGLHHHKRTNRPPNFGLDFPLNMSTVMASLVQPFLPIHTPKQATQLQIKKTSWKTMKKFIKSLDKDQIIKSKDQGKTEVVILDIDFNDQAILNFVPYRLPKKEAAPLANGDKASEQSDSNDISVGQTLKCVSLHKPKDKLAPLFETSKSDLRGYFISSEIRDIVTAYIEHEQLVNPKNKRIISLNPFLANAVFDGKGAQDKEVLAKGTVPRDILIERVIAGCSPYHIMQRNSATSSEPPKAKSGSPPKITILLETRSGNKTVTKVSGLEAYYINPVPLAEELRKTCAGSTSVERLQGSSPKTPIMEVMVQGPQKDAVTKALEKRGVEKRWIEVVDKTKKKK
ncbi:hypothetical protein BLS_004102 [Venturia inaequalis]|uniref:SUI1 domain-containing protein n=1 Tax=Venturia inaequalis TaxID=5025 RepID=A0A8H3UHZ6_VENIN|nr:hypothetical protein EG327_010427 [Venturia inaequalis]KAE9970951.1 hypothetical protein EG328_005967 [Venturia inaequalis]KAE9972230.1 hypothetical protein BLS_004102 [Venturia inaequalis]RDI87635.1 Actin, gamma [Venturia inaequalis]